MSRGATPPAPSVLADVERYYSGRLAEHGATARGVDWNGEEGQFVRFRQLEKLLPSGGPFSVNDIGCGYGALLGRLRSSHESVDYLGCDISAAMIDAARRLHHGLPGIGFEVASAPSRVADFGLASGIFNVRLDRSDEAWFEHMAATLDVMDRTSLRGFAFNCLTSYSDPERMRGHLFYADPCGLFDLCKRRYARDVALLHDYGLYEFTILVRKQP